MTSERENVTPPLPGHATLGDWALFLDLDGTLLDLAPTPDSVSVPGDLIETLAALQIRLDGALAILSGRSLGVIDHLLQPLRITAAGEHGASLRWSGSDPASEEADAVVPEAWRRRIHEMALSWPGALVEEKPHGIAVHYRANPALETEVSALLGQIVDGDRSFEVLPAVLAREIRHRLVNKGAALRRLMRVSPFDGRRPFFIGDDVTDEDAIEAAAQLGGVGLRVAEGFAGGPADVRTWLRQLSGRG